MNRSHVWFALLLLVLPWSVLHADDTERQVLERIEQLRGEVTRDEKVPGKPVRAVDLSHRQLTDSDLKGLGALTELQYLNLMKCAKLTDAGLKELANCKQLQILLLQGNKLTDAGVKELANCKQLQELNLGSCDKVTDAGVKELANCKQLQTLSLRHCSQVTKAALAELQKALPKLEIEHP